MKIIDIAAVMGQQNSRERSFTAPDQMLSFMDRYGIDQAVASTEKSKMDFWAGNAEMSRIQQETDGRITACYVLIPPVDAGFELGASGLYDYLNANRPSCVRVYPDAGKWSLNPAYCGEMMEVLQQLRIPVLCSGSHKNHMEEYPQLLEAFPELRLVLLRFARTRARYLVPLMRKYPNVYTDTGDMADYASLERLVNVFGEDRFLFSAAIPRFDPCSARGLVYYSNLRENQKEKIFSGNFLRLKEEIQWT